MSTTKYNFMHLQIVSTARLSELQKQTLIRLRAAHLANIRNLAARRKQRIADLQVQLGHVLKSSTEKVSTEKVQSSCAPEMSRQTQPDTSLQHRTAHLANIWRRAGSSASPTCRYVWIAFCTWQLDFETV